MLCFIRVRTLKCKTGKCGTKLQKVENAGTEKGDKKVWNAVCQITFVGRL